MLKVYKFGGAVLNDILGFRQLAKIISAEAAETKVILVISALEKTTAKLGLAAKFAEKSENYQAIKLITEVFDYHKNIVSRLLKNDDNINDINIFLSAKYEELLQLIRGISITQELTLRTNDIVLSYGEIIASQIVSAFLSDINIQNTFFDASEIIITDSNFGSANPDIDLTNAKINEHLFPILKRSNYIVTQGFIASSCTGEVTTMGLESSNLTATILAGLLAAAEFVIWTDVEGIRNADPKIFKKTLLIANISYELAEFLSYSGLKLIYPKMIFYLRKFDLEVTFKSGFNVEGEYSIISEKGDDIAYKMLILTDVFRGKKNIFDMTFVNVTLTEIAFFINELVAAKQEIIFLEFRASQYANVQLEKNKCDYQLLQEIVERIS